MKTAPGYKCDGKGCSAERTETNHWLVVLTNPELLGIKGFIAYPWADDIAESKEAVHLCGDTCALKAFSDWLSKIRTAPSAELPPHDPHASQGRPETGLKGLPV